MKPYWTAQKVQDVLEALVRRGFGMTYVEEIRLDDSAREIRILGRNVEGGPVQELVYHAVDGTWT